MIPKNKGSRCVAAQPRARLVNHCQPNTSTPEIFGLAPLLPPADWPSLPSDFWKVHRWRKGGER